MTKKELTEFIRKYFPDVTDTQQARHLGRQKGWYVVSSRRKNHLDTLRERKLRFFDDSYYLVSLEEEYPGWTPERRKGISTEDFEKLKKLYDYRCATCGSKEGEPNLKNPSRITDLQKAHLNPHRAGDGYIPQCEECNRAYRDWFVFDKKGRVRTIADARVVLRADEKVQRDVYMILKSKFERKGS
ncbi:MAG: hypothetical protein NZ927_06845 [Candidatus Calescibacterium sp.]|nr:hypothetical protein [Candidatus Calescibacterium sp.]MDW8087640.1 hypothetical protein [Candidatus Calescibacterium sp.]